MLPQHRRERAARDVGEAGLTAAGDGVGDGEPRLDRRADALGEVGGGEAGGVAGEGRVAAADDVPLPRR